MEAGFFTPEGYDQQADRRAAGSPAIVRPPMVAEQVEDVIGRPRVEWVYHIGKRDSFVVVAQLWPEFYGAAG